MRLRTPAEVRGDIEHTSACLAALDGAEHWADVMMIDRYRSDLDQLHEELARAEATGLRVVLDGRGVHGHTIATDRLTEFLDDFQRSMRHVAAGQVRSEGDSFATAERMMTDVHLASLFDGSVGLKLTAPPGPMTGEQMDMLRPPLFDRTVERVLDVLAAAQQASGVEEAVLDLASDLSADAVKALEDLANSMSTAGAVTRFAWHGTTSPGSKFLSLMPGQASDLAEILAEVTPVETTIELFGMLASVDSHDGSFHLVVDDVDYRGQVAAGMLAEAQQHVYNRVRVNLIEQTATGRFARRSRPKYTLHNFPN